MKNNISHEYAEALFLLSCEEKSEEKYLSDQQGRGVVVTDLQPVDAGLEVQRAAAGVQADGDRHGRTHKGHIVGNGANQALAVVGADTNAVVQIDVLDLLNRAARPGAVTEAWVDLYHSKGSRGACGVASDQLLAGRLVHKRDQSAGLGVEVSADVFVLQVQIAVVEVLQAAVGSGRLIQRGVRVRIALLDDDGGISHGGNLDAQKQRRVNVLVEALSGVDHLHGNGRAVGQLRNQVAKIGGIVPHVVRDNLVALDGERVVDVQNTDVSAATLGAGNLEFTVAANVEAGTAALREVGLGEVVGKRAGVDRLAHGAHCLGRSGIGVAQRLLELAQCRLARLDGAGARQNVVELGKQRIGPALGEVGLRQLVGQNGSLCGQRLGIVQTQLGVAVGQLDAALRRVAAREDEVELTLINGQAIAYRLQISVISVVAAEFERGVQRPVHGVQDAL